VNVEETTANIEQNAENGIYVSDIEFQDVCLFGETQDEPLIQLLRRSGDRQRIAQPALGQVAAQVLTGEQRRRLVHVDADFSGGESQSEPLDWLRQRVRSP